MPSATTSVPRTGLHFLIVPMVAMGHTRPASQLALRLIDYDESVTVTLLTVPALLDRVKGDVTSQIPSGLMDEHSRLRVASAFATPVEDNVLELIQPLIQSYPEAYKTLYEEKPITCATTGKVFDAAQAPTAVIIDFAMAPLIRITREITGRSVPIFNWATGSPYSLLRFWAPESLGGHGDLYTRAKEEAKLTGEDEDVVGERLYRQTTGAVVRLPGLPPMYDHEFFPQEMDVPLFNILRISLDAFDTCDGVIMTASPVIDAGGIAGIRTWLAPTNMPVYCVGPLLPKKSLMIHNEDTSDITTFLTRMLEKYGEHSLVLVTFGTFSWPPVQDYIDEVITAFIEKKMPFIIAHPSPFVTLSDELILKIKSSGIGICCGWVPQQYVLAHPATGWCLTHGGQGGVTEALGNGVPLICWPISADHPVATANVSLNLHAGFELLEVRTGQGLQAIYRLQGRKPIGTREAVGREIRVVLDEARGEVGREMRRTVQAIRERMHDSWAEKGVALSELRAFVKKAIQMKGL